MAEIVTPSHPYSPASAPLAHYAPNDLPLVAVVGSLAAMLGFVALGSASLAARTNPRLGAVERCIVGWFSICTGSSLVLLGVCGTVANLE